MAAIQMAFAVLKARRALARITRPKRGAIDDIPAYLRRDLGLPEAGPGWTEAVPNHIAILAHLRLK